MDEWMSELNRSLNDWALRIDDSTWKDLLR